MNWNIQNFGATKAGLLYRNYDVVQAIAEVVVREEIDIFVMLEVNTTNEGTARELASVMRDALRREDDREDPDLWMQTVISPNTGAEFYAFFVRDSRITEPLPFVDMIGRTFLPEILNVRNPIADAIWEGDPDDYDVMHYYFPLLGPDVRERSAYGRPRGFPPWPGVRYPVLGLFRVAGATAANEILPIVACHFAPAAVLAQRQFRTLFSFSLLNGLAPNPYVPPVTLRIRRNGTVVQRTPRYYVLTGDFNVDYTRNAYAAIVGTGRQELGATAAITDNTVLPDTMLMTYRQFDAVRPKTTAEFAVSNFDNFFLRQSAARGAGAAVSRSEVIDIPEDIYFRSLELRASVAHYRELDQRGFASGEYQWPVADFANQLTNRTTMVTRKGSLVGARLISDHLPAIIDLRVT
ncbi:MAG TPA: hypothetical protein VEK11_03460 [Thermoanaerobaculia bacterium]|nr:hypothetical protein [Thermoanaerobaculia bacterium]